MTPVRDDHPLDLVGAARDLLIVPDAATAGMWPRAAALLGRQALEQALHRLWALRAPGLEETSARCQLLCLQSLLGDPDLAGRVAHAWWALSRASHYHAYELPPTHAELNGWLEAVWDLGNRVEVILAGARAKAPSPP
jgi:hypothetical protein